MRSIFLFLIFGVATSVYACKLPYIDHDMVFERGSTVLSKSEIHGVIEWRDNTRRAFPGGFVAYIRVWENGNANVPKSMAQSRADFVRGLLENLGVKSGDIEVLPFRQSREAPQNALDERFFDAAEVVIEPRCPHACCDMGDIR